MANIAGDMVGCRQPHMVTCSRVDIRSHEGTRYGKGLHREVHEDQPGYMGQLVEWPEVVTEGKTLEECRVMLRDALREMIAAYKQQGCEIPLGDALLEQVPVGIGQLTG